MSSLVIHGLFLSRAQRAHWTDENVEWLIYVLFFLTHTTFQYFIREFTSMIGFEAFEW